MREIETRRARKRRGASGLTYGILVGLVAVVAITAISNAGGSVNRLFGTVATRLIGVRPAAPGIVSGLADCQAILDANPGASDGTYTLDVDGAGPLAPFSAYCDIRGAEGWTLIAYNDATTTFTNFNKAWAEYKAGFGGPAAGTLSLGWIGNDRISALTQGGVPMEVRTNVMTHVYASFTVGAENSNYLMTVVQTPQSGDAHAPFVGYHSGRAFSTSDRDNDAAVSSSCAQVYASGWWYNSCYNMSFAGTDQGQVYWRNNSSLYFVTTIGMWVR